MRYASQLEKGNPLLADVNKIVFQLYCDFAYNDLYSILYCRLLRRRRMKWAILYPITDAFLALAVNCRILTS